MTLPMAVAVANTSYRCGVALRHLGLDPTLASSLGPEVARIRRLRQARAERRKGSDPLLGRAASRPYRTRTALAAAEARDTAWRQQREAEAARWLAERDLEDGIRRSLIAAARIARGLGLSVRSSKARDGRVSSYYCSRQDMRQFRISDHEIPETADRLAKAMDRGELSYDGYRGGQLIIHRPRSGLWLRRAIILLAAGRCVPEARHGR